MKKTLIVLLAMLPLFLVAQDSVPPLISFKDADIDTVTGDYLTKIIVLRLKDGRIYKYESGQALTGASAEDYHGKKYQVVMGFKYKFTKTEHAPYYPGGEEGWDKYLKQFISDHAAEADAAGHGTATISMLVDFNGNVSEIEIYKQSSNEIGSLARKAVTGSGRWMPAIQNHWRVTALHKIEIGF